MMENELDKLMPGLTHSKSKKEFYDTFKDKIGVYPTLALLGLHGRSQVFMSELKMIAYIAELYCPIKLLNYNFDESKLPDVCFIGKLNEYIIRFEMQVKIKNHETDKYYSPDLKLSIIQSSNGLENEIESIAIEYEGHSSHLDPSRVKSAFLRNRHITYRIGGPVLPYYKEELEFKKNRDITLGDLKDFIKEKVDRFERSAIFASNNQLIPRRDICYTPPTDIWNSPNTFRYEYIYNGFIDLIDYIKFYKKDAPIRPVSGNNVFIKVHECNSDLALALHIKGRVNFIGDMAFIHLKEFSHLRMHEQVYLAERISKTLSNVFKVSCSVCTDTSI